VKAGTAKSITDAQFKIARLYGFPSWLNDDRIPMMELLLSDGAAVNAEWNGDFPIVFAPCEAVDPAALKWLIDHGANPNCGNSRGRGTALDYLIGTYERSPERLSTCIDILLDAGGTTRYSVPGVLEVLRRQLDRLAEQFGDRGLPMAKLLVERGGDLNCARGRSCCLST
jgi:hypothetical protein